MKITFIPLGYDSIDVDGKTVFRITGRDREGIQWVLFDTCPIYMWAILKDKTSEKQKKELIAKIKDLQTEKKERVSPVLAVTLEQKKFLGKGVEALKVHIDNYKDLLELRTLLKDELIDKRRGYDLGAVTHYIIEKDFVPSQWYELEVEAVPRGTELSLETKSIHAKTGVIKKIKKIDDAVYEPQALAFDIETDEVGIGEGEIVMISVVGKNFKKVLTWKETNAETQSFVEKVADEKTLLERFVAVVHEKSPDMLVGYFSDGFDMPYLKARAEYHGVSFGVGIDGSVPKIARGITPIVRNVGIVHVDLLKFVKTAYGQYMQSESFSLNEIAKEFLGEEKKKFAYRHSSKVKSHEWNEYYEYNAHDSVLTYKLFEKFWPDLLEFSRVIQEPIFEVCRNGMSKNVDTYLLHHLRRFNEIPEKKPAEFELSERSDRERYEGAFVYEPKPGLYENVVFFDFTSYWPSIIVTFNLSKETYRAEKEKNTLAVDIGKKEVYFTKKIGFFSELLKELVEKRKQFKKELHAKPDVLKKARSNAFKVLANAAYGYMGFFGARYYCPEASASATAISRDFIKKTIENIAQKGYSIIYSDTDSIAFEQGKKSKKDIEELLKHLNENFPGTIALELEGFFKRGVWVSTRAGTVGAKKKYALIDDKGTLKIRGFETVRRDWCPLARTLQSDVLRMILEDGNEIRALTHIKETIQRLKARTIPLSELLLKTQIKKSLESYKSITPHVVAAQKMHDAGIPFSAGSIIEYYIAETPQKTKLIREKVKLVHEEGVYDISYYLENQLEPAIENLLKVFAIDSKTLITQKQQKTLADF